MANPYHALEDQARRDIGRLYDTIGQSQAQKVSLDAQRVYVGAPLATNWALPQSVETMRGAMTNIDSAFATALSDEGRRAMPSSDDSLSSEEEEDPYTIRPEPLVPRPEPGTPGSGALRPRVGFKGPAVPNAPPVTAPTMDHDFLTLVLATAERLGRAVDEGLDPPIRSMVLFDTLSLALTSALYVAVQRAMTAMLPERLAELTAAGRQLATALNVANPTAAIEAARGTGALHVAYVPDERTMPALLVNGKTGAIFSTMERLPTREPTLEQDVSPQYSMLDPVHAPILRREAVLACAQSLRMHRGPQSERDVAILLDARTILVQPDAPYAQALAEVMKRHNMGLTPANFEQHMAKILDAGVDSLLMTATWALVHALFIGYSAAQYKRN